jgi:hypothetical protein
MPTQRQTLGSLLTRDEFREAVFARDKHKCVICGSPGQDAHHIFERRLYADGGYYLSNGGTLCGSCHLRAEETTLSVEDILGAIGLERGQHALPAQLYSDMRYDKWGNPVLDNGHRLRGELFYDESVQKVLFPVLHLFTNRVKYPRTYHLPWSPGITDDDRVLSQETIEKWDGHLVVITEKMDGENTTMYRDGIHARSLEYEARYDRDRIKALHASMAYKIDEGMRVCGENLTAVHSIRYENLPHFFMVYGIWVNETCLSWGDTETYAAVLGLPTVPVLWEGIWSTAFATTYHELLDFKTQEGYVVRPAGPFSMREYATRVGKYVREGHVQNNHGHWTRRRVEWNTITGDLE